VATTAAQLVKSACERRESLEWEGEGQERGGGERERETAFSGV